MTASPLSPNRIRFCTKCDYSTPYLQSLKTHLFKYHGLNVEEAKPFVCKVCPYRTNYKGNLRKHLRTHTGERPYLCRVCGKGFTTTSNLKTHEIHRHGLQRSKRPAFMLPTLLSLPVQNNETAESNDTTSESPDATAIQMLNEMQCQTENEEQKQVADTATHKSPASNSLLSGGSSDDIMDGLEDQKPVVQVFETSTSEDERREDGTLIVCPKSPDSPAQACSSLPDVAVFPEVAPQVSIKVENKPKIKTEHRTEIPKVRHHSQLWERTDRGTHRREHMATASPRLLDPLNIPDPRQFMTDQQSFMNLCTSMPHIPPSIFASISALQHQACNPPPAHSTQTPGSTDELTKALLDQLVKEGRLYRCNHCNILFPEISMYIFHRGCHGQGSAFQCHFCHTIFREKFEFLAHFMYCVHTKK